MADKKIRLKEQNQDGTYDYLFPATKSSIVDVNGKTLDVVLSETNGKITENNENFTTQLAHTDKRTSYVQSKGMDISPPARVGKRTIVSFVSDDAQIQDWTVLKPIFEEENVPMVVAAPSTNVTGQIGFVESMSDDQMLYLQNELGWEIASHTRTHPKLANVALELGEESLEDEIGLSKKELEARGFEISNLVYPFGSSVPSVWRIARKYYRSAYAFGNRTENTNEIPYVNSFEMKRASLGAFFDVPNEKYPITNTFEDYYKKQVDDAVAKEGWLIFTMHPVNANFNATQQGYLKQTIQYIKSLGIDIVTLNEGLDRTGNILELEKRNESTGAMLKQLRVDPDLNLWGTDILTVKAANDKYSTNNIPTDFEKGKTTINLVDQTNPNNPPNLFKGMLYTDYTSTYTDWVFQYFIGRESATRKTHLYSRLSNVSGTGWENWTKINLDSSPKIPYYKVAVGDYTIPAKSVKNYPVEGLTVEYNSVVVATPASPLPVGLTFNTYIDISKKAGIQIQNTTDVDITINITWNVKLIAI